MQVRREERTFQVNMSVEWCVLIRSAVSLQQFWVCEQCMLNSTQVFIQDFQFGGGRCCVWVNWDEQSTFPITPRMVLKALWFHFADK